MPSKRPNIIVTIADDQRFDTIAAHGNRQILTPNLDRLAERGTSYRRALGRVTGRSVPPAAPNFTPADISGRQATACAPFAGR